MIKLLLRNINPSFHTEKNIDGIFETSQETKLFSVLHFFLNKHNKTFFTNNSIALSPYRIPLLSIQTTFDPPFNAYFLFMNAGTLSNKEMIPFGLNNTITTIKRPYNTQ